MPPQDLGVRMRIRSILTLALTVALCMSLLALPATAASGGGFDPLDGDTGVVLDDAPRTSADIINGTPVKKGHHPYVALILLSTRKDGTVTNDCTGTMITGRHVLTAAHCLSKVRYAAAAPKLTNLKRLTQRKLVPVIGAKVHPRWRPAKGRNDIAVLELARKVKVKPAKLAGKRDARLRPGTAARAIGWGVNDNEAFTFSDHLLQGDIELWGNGACKAAFGGQWAGGTMLCGGAPTVDVCFGDSGGPLLVRRHGRWLQHGITSFGDAECATDDASAYTRVSAYGTWIKKLTGLTPRR